MIRSKTDIEISESGRETIVVSEIPYMVNKRELIEKIAELVENKKLEGIAYINDESDRSGMRIVIKLKICLLYTSSTGIGSVVRCLNGFGGMCP